MYAYIHIIVHDQAYKQDYGIVWTNDEHVFLILKITYCDQSLVNVIY